VTQYCNLTRHSRIDGLEEAETFLYNWLICNKSTGQVSVGLRDVEIQFSVFFSHFVRCRFKAH